MRTAFLPGLVMLAGSVAWGQAPAGATAAPVEPTPQTNAPVLVLQAQRSSSRTLMLNPENALTLQLEQRGQALARLAAQREAAQASLLEPIPTQWPHAKAEQIPTQWKVQVVLVGGTPAPPAKQPAGTAAGAVVTPR